MIVVAATLALLLSIGLLCARRIGTATRLCALQGLCAAAALGGTDVATALLAGALNGIALPAALARSDGAAPLGVRGRAVLSWAAVVALLLATNAAVAPAGVAVALLGLSLIGLRSHALLPVVGLLSSQNGIVLVAAAQPALARPMALAVAVPLVPALVLAESWLRR